MRKHIAAERMASGAKFTTKLNDLDVTDDCPPQKTDPKNSNIIGVRRSQRDFERSSDERPKYSNED